MSRTGKKIRRKAINPDLLYGNRLLARFINRVMHDGKKSTAQNMVYKALDIVKSKNLNPTDVFQGALQNVGPKMEVKPRRVGGASYQVPMEVRGERFLLQEQGQISNITLLPISWLPNLLMLITIPEKQLKKEISFIGMPKPIEPSRISDGN